MKKCNVNYHNECQRDTYKDNNECILHCKKNDYSQSILSDFYNEFIVYVVNNIIDDFIRFENKALFLLKKFNKDKYLNEKKILETSLYDYLKKEKFDNKKYNEIFKKILLVVDFIHFPIIDRKSNFDYVKILNLFEKIHFNYCEFYLSNLDLKNTECFFQDCKFHADWILYNYRILENQDNVIYQTCEFYKSISNYRYENRKELVMYEYSQFDYTCKFYSNIKFNRVYFKEMLFNTNQNNYLEENTINQIIFENCIFDSKFKLNNFKIDVFKIIDTIFKNKFEFKDNILNEFLIDNSNFEKIADFFGSEFKKFKIYKSIFDDFVGFENCKFGTDDKEKEEIAIFKYATFLSFINFRETKFKSGLDIENINIKEAPNFLNIFVEFKNTNRETFRIIKYSFEKINNNIEANKFFVQEMKKYKEDLKKRPLRGNIQEKIIFNLNDAISSFGQSYIKPILWLIIFSLLYNFILYSYEQNWLYMIYPPVSPYIKNIVVFCNDIVKNILPITKFLKKDLEFLSLLFYIIFSILIWQIIVSIKRYTKR